MGLHCLQAGYPVTLLSEQHRMHPAIAVWPSTFFYQGQLVTARSLADGKARRADFHSQPCFPPLAFFDCRQEGADKPSCLDFIRPCLLLKTGKARDTFGPCDCSLPAQQVLEAENTEVHHCFADWGKTCSVSVLLLQMSRGCAAEAAYAVLWS